MANILTTENAFIEVFYFPCCNSIIQTLVLHICHVSSICKMCILHQGKVLRPIQVIYLSPFDGRVPDDTGSAGSSSVRHRYHSSIQNMFHFS